MTTFKTQCPFCDETNLFDVPSYRESLVIAEELIKQEDTKEAGLDMKNDLLKEKDLLSLDEYYAMYTPIFCKQCNKSYYFNIKTNEYDFIDVSNVNFSTETIFRKLASLPDKKDVRPCYIYFLYSPKLKLTKIGFSSNIKKRQQQLKVSCIDTILVYRIKTIMEYKYIHEQLFHSIFQEHKVRGEWYDISSHNIAVMKRNEKSIVNMLNKNKSVFEIKQFLIEQGLYTIRP